MIGGRLGSQPAKQDECVRELRGGQRAKQDECVRGSVGDRGKKPVGDLGTWTLD